MAITNSPTTSQNYQHTLQRPFSCIGQGVHSGEKAIVTVTAALPNSGYTIRREDIEKDKQVIHARWFNVTDTKLSTRLSNKMGVSASTVEHLLAALYAHGIDNAEIKLTGPEIPIMDGSAEVFSRRILEAGKQVQCTERYAIVVTRPVSVSEGDASASLSPFPRPWLDMMIDFEHPVIGKQQFSTPVNSVVFDRELARARTFGFKKQLTTLRDIGFAKGGSLNNAVLLGDNEVCNPEGLRYRDEFVRHKCLDAIGDLALAGATIFGKFTGYCSGHRVNNLALEALFAYKNAWRYVPISEARRFWQRYDEALPYCAQRAMKAGTTHDFFESQAPSIK